MRSTGSRHKPLGGPRRSTRLGFTLAFSTALLVLYLSRHSTNASFEQTARNTTSPGTSQQETALGLNHFTAHCASCHGETGKADTEKGRALGAADLTGPEVQSMSDSQLVGIVTKGVPGTAMPAFGKTHSAAEIRQTILFLRRLPTLTADERKELEAVIPATARHKPEVKEESGHQHEQHAHDPATRPVDDKQSKQPHQHQNLEQRRDAASPSGPSSPPKEPAADPHHSHAAEKSSTHGGTHEMSEMMTTISGGPFRSMHSIGSGTSLLAATTPGHMWHWMKDDWMIMVHGNLSIGLNHQGGPRGVNKAESQNWLMLMAERPTEGGSRLMLRGMFSAEPATTPRGGFPELFQTGESYKGRPIVDAQHPHDLFMELSASFTLPLSEKVSLNLYGGPVAEPALGPVAFMHRTSASENPSAPLGHHWQDSTHIAHGVFTAGVTAWKFKIESSIFRGAEPDEDRTDLELGKLDSWSARVWFTPTPNWTLQFSRGHLTNPESLEPGDTDRTTASISHNRTWSNGNWATTLVWGRNSEQHGDSNAYLLESTANFRDKNYLYTRLELVDKLGLLQDNIFGRQGGVGSEAHRGLQLLDTEAAAAEERWFRVGAVTVGGVRDIVASSKLRVGIGADATFYHVPNGLKSIYGSSPASFHLFLRLRPGKMSH